MEHFVCHYTAASYAQIAFAWNGQHAEQFVDAHLGFRREVIAYCLAHSERVPTALWRDLFWAEAEYSCEAWSVLAEFHVLAQHLLISGGVAVLDDFVAGFHASFDTYASCQSLELPLPIILKCLPILKQRWQNSPSGLQKNRYEGTLSLFTNLLNRQCQKGG